MMNCPLCAMVAQFAEVSLTGCNPWQFVIHRWSCLMHAVDHPTPTAVFRLPVRHLTLEPKTNSIDVQAVNVTRIFECVLNFLERMDSQRDTLKVLDQPMSSASDCVSQKHHAHSPSFGKS